MAAENDAQGGNAAQGSGTVEAAEPLMRYFEYAHLPAHLQDASSPFWLLADRIVRTVPRCAERTVALRKLLEGKDCAVRAMLPARPNVESADRFRGSILSESQGGPNLNNIDPAAAVYAFAGWLTSRDEVTTMSSHHDAAPIAELVIAFNDSQGFPPPEDGWDKRLKPYPSTAANDAR